MKRRLFIAIEDTKTGLTLPKDKLEKDSAGNLEDELLSRV